MLGDAFGVDFSGVFFDAPVLAVLSFAFMVSSLPLLGQTKVAAAPPMGWNSWNHFAGHVTDADVRSAADSLVSTGMRDAGYVYVNVDDTWQGKRDADGVLHANERFPDMKALGDYIHSKGLSLGFILRPGRRRARIMRGAWGMRRRMRSLTRSGASIF